MSSQQEVRFLHVLDSHGFTVPREAIAEAFKSQDSREQMKAWVDEYLQHDIVLSGEERLFNEKHELSTGDSRLSVPVTDEDLEAAIASLKASTASIEKQCRLLEAQRTALREIKARNDSASGSNAQEAQRTSKLDRETMQSDFNTEQLSEALQSTIAATTTQAEKLCNSVQPMAERLLDHDDRLLDGLEKLMPRLASSIDSSSNQTEVEQLCQALTLLTTQEVHARIDAAYSSAIASHTKLVNGHTRRRSTQSLLTQRDTLKVELEELCREIEGLSNMAVENQHRAPVLRALRDAHRNAELDRSTWTQYIASVLQWLIDRLDTIDDRSRELRAYRSAIGSVSAALHTVRAIEINKSGSQQQSQSPVKVSQKGLKPLRLVQANFSDTHDPVAQLLRQSDIRASDLGDNAMASESILAAARNKADNMSSIAVASEKGMIQQITESVGKSESEVLALLQAVFGYSEYGSIRLASNETTEAVAALEKQTDELTEKLRRLDVDAIAKATRAQHERTKS